jgi:CheY-like chemotaxis protein
MLKALFALEGHEVYEAVDGPSAIEAMAREHPDIALIDIGLPGIDGYEVASRVRAQPHGADVFLVALTGYGLGADRERSREAGFEAAQRPAVSLMSRGTAFARSEDRTRELHAGFLGSRSGRAVGAGGHRGERGRADGCGRHAIAFTPAMLQAVGNSYPVIWAVKPAALFHQ